MLRTTYFTIFLAWTFRRAAVGFIGATQGKWKDYRGSNLFSSQQLSSESSSSLMTATSWEEWLRSIPGATWDKSIVHDTSFEDGLLRGLLWNDSSGDQVGNKETIIMTIPSAVVLSVDNYASHADWDADLATKLWNECQKGERSHVSGYCSLLLQRSEDSPFLSTAPHSLRHWTSEEKSALAVHPHGRRLLDVQRNQEMAWREKYSSSVINANNMSWEQFEWAMEAVHSRAFCGVQTNLSSSSNVVPALVAPIVSAVAGYAYMQQVAFPSDAVLAGLVIAGAAPTLLSCLAKETPSCAVLLPFVDSANHLDSAESSIAYNPATNCFELSIEGTTCIDPVTRQLYIRYGTKSDAELLLNYGFLPDVPMHPSASEYRRQLAARFTERARENRVGNQGAELE